MNITDILIGTKWFDTINKIEVVITDKTSNSIEYKDAGRFMSWVSIETFTRVERSNNKMRFERVI
jgi:hypothetical protein